MASIKHEKGVPMMRGDSVIQLTLHKKKRKNQKKNLGWCVKIAERRLEEWLGTRRNNKGGLLIQKKEGRVDEATQKARSQRCRGESMTNENRLLATKILFKWLSETEKGGQREESKTVG